jgi:hypothetical protein
MESQHRQDSREGLMCLERMLTLAVRCMRQCNEGYSGSQVCTTVSVIAHQGVVGVQLLCRFWSGCWAPPGIRVAWRPLLVATLLQASAIKFVWLVCIIHTMAASYQGYASPCDQQCKCALRELVALSTATSCGAVCDRQVGEGDPSSNMIVWYICRCSCVYRIP